MREIQSSTHLIVKFLWQRKFVCLPLLGSAELSMFDFFKTAGMGGQKGKVIFSLFSEEKVVLVLLISDLVASKEDFTETLIPIDFLGRFMSFGRMTTPGS